LFVGCRDHRAPHSFPTRRSSDLDVKTNWRMLEEVFQNLVPAVWRFILAAEVRHILKATDGTDDFVVIAQRLGIYDQADARAIGAVHHHRCIANRLTGLQNPGDRDSLERKLSAVRVEDALRAGEALRANLRASAPKLGSM